MSTVPADSHIYFTVWYIMSVRTLSCITEIASKVTITIQMFKFIYLNSTMCRVHYVGAFCGDIALFMT